MANNRFCRAFVDFWIVLWPAAAWASAPTPALALAPALAPAPARPQPQLGPGPVAGPCLRP